MAIAAGKSGSTPAHSFVADMTSSIYRALAHLCSLAAVNSFHRKNFSRDVVACLLEDIWPDVLQVRVLFFGCSNQPSPVFLWQLMQYLAVDRRDPVSTEPPIAAIALNAVKYATSAALFLGLTEQVRGCCAAAPHTHQL